jgi:hypothetical protein
MHSEAVDSMRNGYVDETVFCSRQFLLAFEYCEL